MNLFNVGVWCMACIQPVSLALHQGVPEPRALVSCTAAEFRPTDLVMRPTGWRKAHDAEHERTWELPTFALYDVTGSGNQPGTLLPFFSRR